MIRIVFVILLFPYLLFSQEVSVKSMPYFSTIRGLDHENYITGFILAADYSLTQDRVVDSYLELEIEYANMESSESSSNIKMYSLIGSYKLMSDYNFFASFRFRYSFASRGVSFGANAYPLSYSDTYNSLNYHCIGPELIVGKRMYFKKEGRLYFDLGVGAAYNYTLKTNMDILFFDHKLPKFWRKLNVQLGCKL